MFLCDAFSSCNDDLETGLPESRPTSLVSPPVGPLTSCDNYTCSNMQAECLREKITLLPLRINFSQIHPEKQSRLNKNK